MTATAAAAETMPFGDQQGTRSGGVAATQGRRAMEDSGEVDQGGRLARTSAAALGPEPQTRRKVIVSAAAPAAIMVVRKQGN